MFQFDVDEGEMDSFVVAAGQRKVKRRKERGYGENGDGYGCTTSLFVNLL